jgi:hypothetical protein
VAGCDAPGFQFCAVGIGKERGRIQQRKQRKATPLLHTKKEELTHTRKQPRINGRNGETQT